MGGISALHHEALDIAMENGAIVLAGGGERQEIKGGPGASITKDFAFEITDRCMNRNGHGGVYEGWFGFRKCTNPKKNKDLTRRSIFCCFL
jgi:hypothetical protein